MRKLLAGVAIGLGAAGLVFLIAWPGWLETAELKTYDWRMRTLRERLVPATSPVNPNIVLVELNDATIRDLAEVAGRWPWPRALSALLVDYLHRGAPKVIAFDIGFWEPEREATYPFLGDEWTGARSDSALAEAVRRAGNVILLANAVDPGLASGELTQKPWPAPAYRLGPEIEARPVITLPYDGLAAAAAGLGHNFLALDPDGPARRMLPFVRKDARYMPSLGMAAALVAGGFKADEVVMEGSVIKVRDRRIPLVKVQVADAVDPSRRHDQQTMLINYRALTLVDGRRPYPVVRGRAISCAPRVSFRRAKSPTSIRVSSRTRSFSSV